MPAAVAAAPPPKTLIGESLLSLTAASRLLGEGRHGALIHPATLTRWILRGVRNPDGDRVRLEAIRCGVSWRTSREALERFTAATTPTMATTMTPTRTPLQRQRESERANTELAKAGW